MESASSEKIEIKNSRTCEIDESVKKTEIKSDGFFRSNSWKATLVIVLISLLIRCLLHRQIAPTKPEGDYAADDEPFLDLISEKYDDHDLYEWEPAPEPISKPDEPGNLGSAVIVPDEMQEEAKRLFSLHQFNLVANEMMSLNRTVDDLRPDECTYIKYPKKLPQVSVIIVYHNEAWSTLLRTVWSVITQSPRELLKEIILVDDSSTLEHLGKKLSNYVKGLPVPVKLASTLTRVGLIQARLLGASKATASILVFLDSHCECGQSWIEPLVFHIMENRKTIAVPVIDVINDEDMQITPSRKNIRGGFDLALSFTWDSLLPEYLEELKNDRTAPVRTPTMPGGLFAMDKEYFYKLGSYDDKQLYWGGENLELSVRTWTCGGRILFIPCSRVGHLYRKYSPIPLPRSADLIVAHNLDRFADVWLDEYKRIYYSFSPIALAERTNVTERKTLRRNLKCKSFRWYLENIFPESPYNMQNFIFGTIESLAIDGLCLDTTGLSRHDNRSVYVKECHDRGAHQVFLLGGNNEIREKKYCFDATYPGVPVTLLHCHKMEGNQKWIYDPETNEIRHGKGTKCLTIQDDSDVVTIAECDGSDYQQWVVQERSISTEL